MLGCQNEWRGGRIGMGVGWDLVVVTMVPQCWYQRNTWSVVSISQSEIVRYPRKFVRYPYDIRANSTISVRYPHFVDTAYIRTTSVRHPYDIRTLSVRYLYAICTLSSVHPSYIRLHGCTLHPPLERPCAVRQYLGDLHGCL